MKKSYVPTTLGQFLNENKSITLTRKYGEKQPVVVGSRAPMRNAVLSYVAENAKVSRVNLKRFIAGLNETSKNPAAAANMWLKRNGKFFESKTDGGVTNYRLSKLGEKLVQVITKPNVGTLSEETKIKSRLAEAKDHDFKDEKTGKKGIYDEDEMDEEGNCVKEEETREDRVKRIVEQIKAKRAAALNEADEEDEEDKEKDEEAEEDADAADDDAEEAADDDEAAEDVIDDEIPAEDDEVPVEDDDRVEITEFIITVDDVEEAIAELADLGIEASAADGAELAPEEDMDMGGELDMDAPEEGGEEIADFDLDLEGGFEGEEEEVDGAEMEESITGGEGFERKVATQNKKTTPNLVEDDDEFKMDDLELDDAGGEEAPVDELPLDTPEEGDELALDDEGGEDDMMDMGDEAAPEGPQIKVSAENWESLKGWLEGKGVDIEDMFGGEIEVEGEEGIEDEISFDGLEDTGEEVPAKGDDDADDDADDADDDKGNDSDDDDEEVDENADDKKDDKKGFQPGKKGVNPFPKK
jgi:hypothetical protein